VPAAPSRLTSSRQFSAVVRRGSRAGTRLLVVHALAADRPSYGLVVSKTVGGAVVRNRVKRRLRPLLSTRLQDHGTAQSVVVRALPAAASATSTDLTAALDSGLRRAASRQAVSTP